MFRLSILPLFLVCILICSCSKEASEDIRIIPVGSLFSISGNWSTLGINSSVAMDLALEDINEYMMRRGSNYRFSAIHFDTKLETLKAREAIEQGHVNNGINIFIGPQSSAEVAAVKDYADKEQILVISQGSTASSMAIPSDAIFRYCPGDAVEGSAIANTMYSKGKRTVISMARNDVGNRGLQHSVGSSFAALGGSVDSIPPYDVNLTGYASLLENLKTKIVQHSSTSGAEKVAVYLASFDECVDIFREASADPVFSSVDWYGGDGVVKSSALLSDTIAGKFAINTGFFAPDFGLPLQPHPDLAAVSLSIYSKSGLEPDAYTLSVYDAMWVIARTIADYPEVLDDFTKMKSYFSYESSQYYGISGPTLLNANGDRNIGSFDYWGIVNEDGAYKWKIVGKSN